MSAASSYAWSDRRWWLADESDRATRLYDTASTLWQDLEPVRSEMTRNARLYSQTPIMGLTPRLYQQRQATTAGAPLSFNIIRSVVDTYVALLTKDRPKVDFMTSGGDWSLQRKAQSLTTFVDGIYYDQDAYELAQQIALDSALFGMGVVKLYSDESEEGDPRITLERILPLELLWDDQEARYGDPKTLYQIKWVDRMALQEAYPEAAEALKTAGGTGFDGTQADNDTLLDLVVVVEAWHLPFSKKSKDGRHMIVCGDVTLVDEEWTRKSFPFEILYRQRPLIGMHAQSLAFDLRGIQKEISYLLLKISRTQHLTGGVCLVEHGSEVNTNQITNDAVPIIRYRGTPPMVQPWSGVAPDMYAHLDRLYSRAYEVIGISQQTAQSEVPPQFSSGKAMMVYADIQSQRFEPCYREYQHFFLRMARQVITLAREVSDAHPSFQIKAAGRGMMRTVKWADANLRDEEFVLQMLPTNKLADDVSARIAQVQNMANAGWIDPEDAKRLLDFPDLASFSGYANAPYDLTMSVIEKMVDEGTYVGPEPYMDLGTPDAPGKAIKQVQLAYLKAKLDGVDEEKLSLLRTWITQARDLSAAQLQQNQPPPPPANGNGGPQGAPPGSAPPQAA